jgi:hypothetical protein
MALLNRFIIPAIGQSQEKNFLVTSSATVGLPFSDAGNEVRKGHIVEHVCFLPGLGRIES